MTTFLKNSLHRITEYTENKPRKQYENDNNLSTSQDNQENVDENVD